MLREIGVVVLTLFASLLLVAGLGYAVARSHDAQVMTTVGREGGLTELMPAEREASFWTSVNRGYVRMAWLYLPGVMLILGALVGVIGRVSPAVSTLLGVGPLALAVSVWPRGAIRGVGFLALYLGIAVASAAVMRRFREGKARLPAGRPTKS